MSELVFVNEADEEMTLNMGPHHPSTHGVLRFVIESDGEILRRVVPDVGYLHRSIEKIAERCTYAGFMPYTDRIDYVAAMFANQAWAMACEKLVGVDVPKRAEYLRVITCELNRISSHMIALGAMSMDVGATTPFMWALREREAINDFIEELCGARLTFNYHRIGGVSFDMPKGWADKVAAWADGFADRMFEFDRLITLNDIYIKRLANVCVVTAAEARDWGLVGPNLRGSGVRWDLRRGDGYSVYSELEFEVPIGEGRFGQVGDCWDRFWVRAEECRQSAGILRQCIENIDRYPEDDIVGKLPRRLRPEGEAYARVESARGDMGCYVIGRGAEECYRARFRTGSFTAMAMIEAKTSGIFLADLVALIASLDIVAPEIDR